MYLLTHQLKLTHVSRKGPWNQLNILRYTNIIIEHFWPCEMVQLVLSDYKTFLRFQVCKLLLDHTDNQPGSYHPCANVLVYLHTGRRPFSRQGNIQRRWDLDPCFYLSLFEDGLCHWKICNAMSHRLNDWFLTVHRHDSVNIVMWLHVTFFTDMV